MGSTSKTLQPIQPLKNARRGPKLREASFGDYEQIASLESRYGLGTRSLERWHYVWLDNPAYRDLQPGWTIGWVIEDENGRIVGSMGNVPLSYEFQGRRILAASGRSWVADLAYRSISLSLVDRVINQPNIDLYFDNTVNAKSAAVVSVFDCARVPVGVWDKSAFWITHYQGFVERLLATKTYRQLAKPLSYPLSAATFLRDRLTAKGLRAGDVEVKVCSGFDDRFDDFWVELKRINPHLLLAVRTREVLEWHFKHALLDNRLWIVTVVDGPRLAAYAIFDRKDSGEFGLKRIRLVDFQSLDGTTALLEPLLSWALRKCRDEGIHLLENVGRWLEKQEFMETVAPHQRKLEAWRFVYRANNPSLAASLREPRAWAPSLFDGDATL
jgi:hypothetical protein